MAAAAECNADVFARKFTKQQSKGAEGNQPLTHLGDSLCVLQLDGKCGMCLQHAALGLHLLLDARSCFRHACGCGLC
jgi:hypothetical protein